MRDNDLFRGRVLKYDGYGNDMENIEEEGTWVEGLLLCNDWDETYIVPVKTDGCTSFERSDWGLKLRYYNFVDYRTIGRCTGVKDKHGKLIFEGDIVKIYDKIAKNYHVGTVFWQNARFVVKVEGLTEDSGLDEYWDLFWELHFNADGTSKVELIGNIHDNPELLQ
ncbi:MAG: YopX family protein [Turicibacter sp.]|nr:YopX family protein [Turicibacter sp.]